MNAADTTQSDAERPFPHDWATLPNAITLVRLVVVIPIAVLIIDGSRPLLTVALLIVFGAGDWVDGYLARRLGQTSRTGAVIDPIADRLGVAVIVLALVIGGFLSLWVVLTIVAVDVALALTYLIMRPSRAPGVSWIGKLRTAVLMTGIVMVGLGVVPELDPLVVAGHVLCGIGTVLHLVAGAGYIASITRDVRGA